MLRIITGSAKNTNLSVPESARPMTDRAKTSIFSMMATRMADAEILDLYAGSGALGLEALSRGAKFAKFIEITEDGITCIYDNIRKCKIENAKTKVLKGDVINYLVKAIHKAYREDEKATAEEFVITEKYDIIFLCPPHPKVSTESLRLASRLMREDGILVAECPADKDLPEECGNAKLELIKKYGKTHIYFYLTKR